MTITAVVRVRAESGSLAREVVASSALASPSADVIRLANEAEFIREKGATVVSVDFSVEEDSITLVEADEWQPSKSATWRVERRGHRRGRGGERER